MNGCFTVIYQLQETDSGPLRNMKKKFSQNVHSYYILQK